MNTKSKFKEWLEKASYKDLLKEYETYRLKLIMAKRLGMRGGYYDKSCSETSRRENIKIIKYKYSLLNQKLLEKTRV